MNLKEIVVLGIFSITAMAVPLPPLGHPSVPLVKGVSRSHLTPIWNQHYRTDPRNAVKGAGQKVARMPAKYSIEPKWEAPIAQELNPMHSQLVDAFLHFENPQSKEFIQKWIEMSLSSPDKTWMRDALKDAKTEAGYRLALLNPLASTSSKFIQERREYLNSRNRDKEESDAWMAYQRAKFLADIEPEFQKDLRDPLSDDSLLTFFHFVQLMKDKQFSPVEITQVLKRIHEASKLYALHYPLHPRADLSIQGWTDFQKNNPSVDASAINSVLETFRKNKINALRYLSRFLDLETPVQFTLQDKLLQILDQVTENNLFSVFNGHILSTESHIAGDLQEETQVKIYKPKMDTYFDREVQVLKSLGRLVALDSQELIIVYQKIQGDFLKDILYHERREYVLKRYEDHYTELVRDFYYSTGLFHGSLKAEDVVIEQETGRFHFINFENSYSPSFDHYNQDPSPLHELEVQKAKQEFHVAILENRAVFALNHHKSGEARLEIQKLIDYLRGIEDYVKANYWQKVYDQTH